MFWERSDSTLSNEQLKDLKSFDFRYEEAFESLRSIFGFSAIIKPVLGGTFNRCLSIENTGGPDLFARFNFHPEPNTMGFHLEQWASDAARHRRFPTPKITYVDTSDIVSRYPFQIVERVEGSSLRNQDEETICKVLVQLGYELAKLHSNPGQCDRYGRIGFASFPAWDLFWMYNMDSDAVSCEQYGYIDSKQFDQIYAIGDTDVQEWSIENPSLLHGDLSYDNILVKDGKLSGVIDWEDAVLGDPVFELAGLATFHPVERHSLFIESYYEGREKPMDFDRRFWTYYLRIALAKTVHRHRFGYTTEIKTGWQNPDNRIQLALDNLKNL